MQLTTIINNAKCAEWGINANQGALVDFINQAASWASPVVIDGVVWYWVSRNKVVEELNLYYSKADTVYRNLKDLTKKEIIHYQKQGEKDIVMLTAKGKTWNQKNGYFDNKKTSEINPNKLGNKSEARKQIREYSETNPNKLGNKSDISSNQLSANHNHTHTSVSGECVSHESALEIISNFKKTKFSKSDLIDIFTVDSEVAESYIEIRAAKKSPLTKIAFKKLVGQAKDAGLTIEQVMTLCAERNWVGFEASWIKSDGHTGKESNISTEFEEYESANWGVKS